MGKSLSLEPRIDKLEQIRNQITSAIEESVGERDWNYELMLALEEAIVNIIEHGMKGQQNPTPIILNLKTQKDKLVLELIDKGTPFDVTQKKDIDFDEHFKAYKSRGLGIFLIQNITDKIQYEFHPETGNHLIMEKNL